MKKKKGVKKTPASFSEFIAEPPVSIALVALALLALVLSMMEFYRATSY